MRFGDLDVAYDDRVLVPRAWTLSQSRWVQDLLPHLPEGDVLEPCSGVGHIDAVLGPQERFVLVVADPPWVPTAAVDTFPSDPVHAIDGGLDGMLLVRACLAVARDHLQPGGVLLLQVGPTQPGLVASEADRHGFRLVEVRAAGQRGAVVRLDLQEVAG